MKNNILSLVTAIAVSIAAHAQIANVNIVPINERGIVGSVTSVSNGNTLLLNGSISYLHTTVTLPSGETMIVTNPLGLYPQILYPNGQYKNPASSVTQGTADQVYNGGFVFSFTPVASVFNISITNAQSGTYNVLWRDAEAGTVKFTTPIQFAAVPEPEIFAAAAAVGLIGFALYRKR